jgi:hypothetical protein
MAEEIVISPEESVSMDAPIVEAPVDVQEDVVDVEPTPPANTDGANNLMKLHKILAADELYSRIVPADFNEFLSNYSDVSKIQKLHKILAADELYGRIMPADINEAADKYGFGGLGKPSAVPSASVVGGSATKGRGVEQPSTLQPRKASEVEQSVMGYGLPKTIDIGGGKANVEEELRLPTEAEFATIEKKIPTKEQKLEEAVRLGTPPVERATKDIKSNKDKILSSEEELNKLEKELATYKQQSDSLLAAYNNEQLSPEERNKAGQEYNKVNEVAKPIEDRRNELYGNYQGYINNQKVLFNELDKAEKMRQKGLEKEYSHLLNLTQSVGRDLVKTVTGMTRMGFTLNDLIPNFGLITPEQEEAGKKALFEGLEATNKFAEKLITQETPENYKKIFEGEFSLGKLAYITTNAVSSTAPTVAAGLLTGGIGSVAAGAGLGFEESKSIMKDAGLSDEQSDWAAMGLAIPIGLLEKYGADDVVRLLNGSGIRRQVASELAKKVAGKTLSREAIFLEAKKTFGEIIKSKTGKILKEGRNEALTEAAQGELQELTKQVVQEFTGVDKDENMSTQDYVMQQLTQRAEEAAGGFLGGTSMQGAGVAFNAALNKQEFSPSAYTKAMEFADPAKFQQFQNDLMLEVQSGVLTEEQANDAIANVQAIQETNALIPNSVQNLDLRTDAVNLIIEKNNIAKEIEGKDPDLTIAENTRLAEIKKSLNEIALGNKPVVEEQKVAQEERKAKTLEDEIEVGDTVDLTPKSIALKADIEERRAAELEPINLARAESERTGEVPVVDGEPVNKKTIDDINAKYDAELEALNKPTVEAQAPVAEQAKPQEKGEFSIQGTFDGLAQVLGDPANMIPDIVRADIEPKFSESNQNGKKIFTLTVPQLDDAGRAGYLAVSLVLPETTTKTIDDVKSALQEKVAEAQAAVKLSREKGFPLETIFKNRVSGEYTEQATPTTEAQPPVAEEAKGEVEQVIALPPEIDSLDDNEIVSIKYETFDEIPESLKSKANKFGGKDVKYRKSILGIPVGKEFTSKTKEGYVVTALGSEIKDAARQTISSQTAATPTSEQAPQPFPAQEGAESVEDKFQANAELEQIYRDLNAAVTKNVDKDTIRMLKANPTEAMVNKAMEELKRKGIIQIEC